MILDDIVSKRKEQLAEEKARVSPEKMESLARNSPYICKDFQKALRQNSLSIIAEVKKASPSKGLICPDFDPVSIAVQYEKAGANAISVLTEEFYFQGHSSYLSAIRKTVNLPILRKDFIVDPYQIYEAKVLGADAVLLIAALLDTDELIYFQAVAKSIGLSCLTEVHSMEELECAKKSGCPIIGINNRNLCTFEVSLQTTGSLIRHVPVDSVIVSESGISSHDDMLAVRLSGADAVLIGETLMRSGDILSTIRTLRQGL